MSVFWLKITYTFLTDRNTFFHPFYRSNYKYFTDYEFLPVIGFNAGDEDNNFLNIKRYAILGLNLYPKNEATTSTFTRELKQLRRRPQRRLQKTKGSLMIKTTALHVHHAFKYISLTSTARLRRKTS